MTNTLKIATDLYSKPALNALGGARVSYRKVTLLTTDLITTQIYALNILPAGHRLVDAFIESKTLDSNTSKTICLSVGVLNTYFGDPAATAAVPAAYSSGGATATDVDPQLVSGQNIITASVVGQGGGRVRAGISTSSYSLTPSNDIGVDKIKDRIIAMQVTYLPATAVGGVFVTGLVVERDQE